MITIIPPYHEQIGDLYAYHSGSGHFEEYLEHIEDKSIGSIHAYNHNQITDSGNSAGQVTYCHSGMLFYFQIPNSGRLSVRCTLRANQAFHSGYMLPDIWGASGAALTQGANFSMWVPPSLEVDGITHNMLYYTRGDEDGVFGGEFAHHGETRQYDFVSQARFNARDWVLLGALVDTFQDAWVDDMDFSGGITNSWIITQLEVDGVP